MKAVILAAGRGSRISTATDAKPLLRLQGLALLERSIANAMRAGVDEFVVVTGYASQPVQDLACDVARRRRVTIHVIENDGWEQGNASSLLSARSLLAEPFLLLMGDHILDERILDRLVEHGLRDDALVLAVDHSDPDAADIDMDDVTRVALEGDRIVRIGKGLPRFHAFDTGAFLCSPEIFDAVDAAMAAGDGSISGAVQALSNRGRAGVVDVTGLPWTDVDTPADASRAAARLGAYTGKSRDGWVSRVLNRPLSVHVTTPLLLRLAPSITANQASAVSTAVGIAATICFGLHLPVAAALLVHLTSVLDGSDGEIARLKRLDSPFGGFFDAVMDRYTDSLIMLGLLYFALTSSAIQSVLGRATDPLILVPGMLAVSGTWLVSYTTTKASDDLGHRYDGAWIGGGRGRDLRLLIVTVAGLVATVQPLAAVAGMAAIAALTHVIVFRRLVLSWRKETGQIELAQVEALIYDLDGTLIDSMPALTERATAIIRHYHGMDAATARERYLATTGLPFELQLEEIAPGHPANRRAAAEFERVKLELMREVEVFPDAEWALTFFASRGVRQFVCSSTSHELVKMTLEQNRLAPLLEDFSGLRRGSDKSRQIRRFLRAYHLRPETTLFVGDSLRDAEFARAARTRFMGLTRTTSEPDFLRAGAESVPDLRVLTTWWKRALQSAISLGDAPISIEAQPTAVPDLPATPEAAPASGETAIEIVRAARRRRRRRERVEM